MDLIESIKNKARRATKNKMIVLTESTEERNLKAADYVLREDIAEIMFIGSEEEVKKRAKELKLDISKSIIVDPKESNKFEEYSSKFYELRKHKGITEEHARELMHDRMYFGTMAVKVGDAHGLVSGAVHKGAYETLRPALQIIKPKTYLSTVSGAFLMCLPTKEFGEDGVLVFADCAVVPEPTAEQLADIAIASSETFSSLVGATPKVAMLSFSTKGSGAENPIVHKIIDATKIALLKRPELMLDGELQADAALVPWIGERKAPGSKVAGHANVLIFPDLNAGNIAYKLVERLAKARATGPILQGLAKPVNDLSRGASWEDIANLIAVTVVQAQNE